MNKVLITGVAGFIGYHLTNEMCKNGFSVIGIDNINDYYSQDLKYARLKDLGISINSTNPNQAGVYIFSSKYENLRFLKYDIRTSLNTLSILENENFDYVINLAAQAGVRYSITNPYEYIDSNITGFLNVLEFVKRRNNTVLVYASSSSIYGDTKQVPFTENQKTDSPKSVYAVSKKTNELLASTYSEMYKIKCIGLRFFTVYGPYGRPDMAPFIFTKSILENKPIDVFNSGNLERDFTYVDDIINGILCVVKHSDSLPLNSVYNIGNGSPVKLMEFINAIENKLGKNALINFLPMQDGDVYSTWASTDKLKLLGYKPVVDINSGIELFINWYIDYYKNSDEKNKY